MSDWRDAFKQEMTEYLRANYIPDLRVITSVEDTTISGGYCETCHYSTAGIEVFYIDTDGIKQYKEIEIGFADLIQRLTGV
jgi:hypothetical protein